MAQFDADQLLTQRDKVSKQIREALQVGSRLSRGETEEGGGGGPAGGPLGQAERPGCRGEGRRGGGGGGEGREGSDL